MTTSIASEATFENGTRALYAREHGPDGRLRELWRLTFVNGDRKVMTRAIDSPPDPEESKRLLEKYWPAQ